MGKALFERTTQAISRQLESEPSYRDIKDGNYKGTFYTCLDSGFASSSLCNWSVGWLDTKINGTHVSLCLSSDRTLNVSESPRAYNAVKTTSISREVRTRGSRSVTPVATQNK